MTDASLSKAAPPAGMSSRLKAGWMRFARALGHINSTILLTLVYFLVLGPIAILHRLAGPDRMGLKKGASGGRFKPFTDATPAEASSPEWARRQF